MCYLLVIVEGGEGDDHLGRHRGLLELHWGLVMVSGVCRMTITIVRQFISVKVFNVLVQK